MKVMLTGGAGYIGTHACVLLQQAGHDIVVVDDFSNSHPLALERASGLTGQPISLETVDLGNMGALREAFARHAPDAVIHFAGLKAVGDSVAQPLVYYRHNLGSTLNLLQVMQEGGCHQLVFSSSATVYAPSVQMPVREDSVLQASNPYGMTKLVIENMLQDLFRAQPQWRIAILRYFNPVGAHPSGQIGESPRDVPNNLMPYVAQVAVGVLPELRIFGHDYPTPDGTGVRDYIHVMDLAQGHLDALHWLATLPAGQIDAFNLGTGTGYSVLQLVEAFKQVSGRPIPYRMVDRRPGDVALCYADVEKACNSFGWRATRGLADMCADAWRWQQQNPQGYQ